MFQTGCHVMQWETICHVVHHRRPCTGTSSQKDLFKARHNLVRTPRRLTPPQTGLTKTRRSLAQSHRDSGVAEKMATAEIAARDDESALGVILALAAKPSGSKASVMGNGAERGRLDRYEEMTGPDPGFPEPGDPGGGISWRPCPARFTHGRAVESEELLHGAAEDLS